MINNWSKITDQYKRLLLPVCGKIFEKIIFSSLFKYLTIIIFCREISQVFRKMILSSLLTIYKSFSRPHIVYGDVTYDQSNISNLSGNIWGIQYNAVVAITGVTREPQKKKKKKIVSEVKAWIFKKLKAVKKNVSFIYRIFSTKLSTYLYEIIPLFQRSHRYPSCSETLRCRTKLP